MPAAATCPYCSLHFRPNRSLAEGERAVCPRCGETFFVEESGGPAVAAGGPQPGESPFRPFVVPAVLGSVLFVAVFGLGLYAIFGRQNEPPPREANLNLSPAERAAIHLDRVLGLLPPEANAVLAARPGLAPAGDLGTLLRPFGLPDGALDDTLRDLGFDPGEVRSVVVGVTVPADNPIPRGVAVVSLSGPPANARDILDRFGARLEGRAAGDARYKATVRGLPAFLRVVDPVTYLVATDAADIDRPPTPGRGHFALSLRESLDRCPADAPLLLATASADWSARPAVALAAQLAKSPDLAKRLAGVRAVAAYPAGNGKLRADILTADTPTRDRLAAALPESKADGSWLSVTLSAGANPLKRLPAAE